MKLFTDKRRAGTTIAFEFRTGTLDLRINLCHADEFMSRSISFEMGDDDANKLLTFLKDRLDWSELK